MKYRLPLAVAACLLPIFATSSAEKIRYEWDVVPNTSYYRGKVQSPNGEVLSFRTRDTWLLFEEGSVVTLESYGADDEPIGPVNLRGASPETPPPEAPEPLPEEPKPEPAPEVAATTPKEPDAAPPEEVGRKGPRDLGHAALRLGIGKEWLEAEGGISDFKGATNIGGTSLDLESQGPGSLWIFGLELRAHNFTTVTKERSTTGTDSSETESKFLRLSVRASALYDWDPENPGYRVAMGLGLAYFRLPVLAIEDDVTGAAALENQTAMGPYLGFSYLRYLSAAHTLGASFEYLPMTLSKGAKGNGSKLLLTWRYAFVRTLYADLGLFSERTNLTTEVDCPRVTGCDEQSKSSSSVLSALMGIGYVW